MTPPLGMPHDTFLDSGRRIWTVSELTSKIKVLLEDEFNFIWITGEISDFKIPSSGHYYFTLKDEKARILAVMFKGQNRNLSFRPEDGMRVVGLGRVSVYEPRGAYQIILEILEPKGVGALQIAFEQLKRRLYEEGLFDERFKKPLPFLPEKIAVLTSPSGAVIHDILHVARRRFENTRIIVIPTGVQGDLAEAQIVSAIDILNTGGKNGGPAAEVAILARGGGSLEDLQAFNSESVARAIFASKIPIVSAVGHETDFTIADFVSDLRAPTPSAAAEIVVPQKADLALRIRESGIALERLTRKSLEDRRRFLNEIACRLKDPGKRIADRRIQLDDLSQRLLRTLQHRIRNAREKLIWRTENLCAINPLQRVLNIKEKVNNITNNIFKSIEKYMYNNKGLFRATTARLQALSPLDILNRGYSIAQTVPAGRIIRDPDQVKIGEAVDLSVARGKILCRVERKSKNGQADL